MLVIDRHPWHLTLYRRTNATTMTPVAVSSFSQDVMIQPQLVPVQFKLATEPTRLCVRKEIGDLV